ncbi:hypothetical protein CYMTET_42823 [Cymbomonas tetramitiformis]|uniref:Mutator-like transposase domain-containing protein n=1 Tax=Cymbomonas tetramitiformis TaxID=36881 RepID=A0AAE0C4N5_9CHLO|nr:hypothetical protein CYMTET_42823 [Cymbomonas tetramitiformis]
MQGAPMAVLAIGNHTLEGVTWQGVRFRIADFTADEDSGMIAEMNHAVKVPTRLKLVHKLSDPNHMKKLMFGGFLKLRKEMKWSGRILSDAIITYVQHNYIYCLKQNIATGMSEADKLHGFSTNPNESSNACIVKGFLPGGKAQQHGQASMYHYAVFNAVAYKNLGMRYRQLLFTMFDVESGAAMKKADERLDAKRNPDSYT